MSEGVRERKLEARVRVCVSVAKYPHIFLFFHRESRIIFGVFIHVRYTFHARSTESHAPVLCPTLLRSLDQKIIFIFIKYSYNTFAQSIIPATCLRASLTACRKSSCSPGSTRAYRRLRSSNASYDENKQCG